MAIDSLLRVFVDDWRLLRKIVEHIAAIGVSPNTLSIVSLLFAALAGLFFSLADPGLLLPAGFFVAMNAILDTADGVLARMVGKASKKGDFLDHVVDRYADMFIIGGIIFGHYVRWEVGLVAIIGVLLTSYMGTQAQAVGLGRMYSGMIGRADRLLLVIAAAILTWLYPYPVWGLSFLGWCMLIFAVLCNVTALQRFFYVWKHL